MKSNIKNLVTLSILTLILATGAVFGQVQSDLAKTDGEQPLDSIEGRDNNNITGSWYVAASSDHGPSFKALITFSDGGGMIASAQGDIIKFGGELSPATAGHGTWVRTGNREFLFTFRQIFYSIDDAGNSTYAGGNKVRHTARMNRAGTEWTGQMTVEFFDENDNVIFTGSGASTGRRIVAQPLLP